MNQQPVLSHGAPVHGSLNLPVRAPEPLVGRTTDQDAIHLALKARTAVMLYGPAGIGKTALLAALAGTYAELPGGVLWLESAGDTLHALLNRVARAYGLPGWDADADLTDIQGQVQHLLDDNRPLIVLDGEVALATAREFAHTCAAGLPLLFTYSKIAAGPWTPQPITLLSAADAHTLLTTLAGDGLAEDEAALPQLTELLAGHPLAIQVAGRALAHATPCADFMAQVPTLPPGLTNSVMATLMAAYRLLSSDLQGMVMLLGTAFAGGASEELLSDVTGAPVDSLRARMRELVARGLAAERSVYDQPYFVAHELVQRFAQSFLRGKRRLDTMRARHLHGLPVFIRRNVDAQAYERLAAEMDNILAAGRYAAERGKTDVLAELVELLDPAVPESFVSAAGFQPEYDWLKYLLEHPAGAAGHVLERVAEPEPADEAPEPESAADTPAPETLPEPDTETVAAADTAADAAPDAAAFAAPTEALPLAEHDLTSTGDEPETAAADFAEPQVETFDMPSDEALTTPEPESVPEETAAEAVSEAAAEAAEMEADSGQAAIPAAEAEAAAPPAEAASDATGLDLPTDAEALDKLGAAARTDSTPSETIARYTTALENYQANGNVEDEIAALQALAMLSLESANYDDVLTYVDKGMQLAQDADNPRREGQMLIVLGDLQLSLGRLEGAEVAYKEAVEALRPTEAWLDMGLTLEKLGSVYWEQSHPQAALDVWTQTATIFDHLARTDLLGETLDKMGDTQTELQQWDAAQASYSRAFDLARARGDQQVALEQSTKLGVLAEARGDRERAIRHYRQALHFALAINEPDALGHTLLALARLLIDDTVNLHRSLQLLEAARTLLPDDTEVQRLLSRAKTRQERLLKAGITLPMSDESLADFARSALDDTRA